MARALLLLTLSAAILLPARAADDVGRCVPAATGPQARTCLEPAATAARGAVTVIPEDGLGLNCTRWQIDTLPAGVGIDALGGHGYARSGLAAPTCTVRELYATTALVDTRARA